MTSARTTLTAALGLALVAAATAAPALAQDRWDWGGGRPEDPRAYELRGPGVGLLLPELRDSRRGQAFVLRNFDFGHDGFITPDEARAANRAFEQARAVQGGPFDWDRYDHRGADAYAGGPPPPPSYAPRPYVQPQYAGGWDRSGMRAYHVRQGRYGALFTLQDVLFQTGSAQLRPGAEAQLLPLASYLKANPGVRVRIDGYTDSVGSPGSNVTLSQNRAQSVAATLAATGVDPARLEMLGHGEAAPVATNDTAEGRQLNRRVEVTAARPPGQRVPVSRARPPARIEGRSVLVQEAAVRVRPDHVTSEQVATSQDEAKASAYAWPHPARGLHTPLTAGRTAFPGR